MIDPPGESPRGEGPLETVASTTGRRPSCRVPKITTLPHADVRFVHISGRPIRGARSLSHGEVPISGLVDVECGTKVIVTAYDRKKTVSIPIATV